MSDTLPAARRGWRDIMKYAVPLIISVGLCYLLFTGIDFNRMIEIIRNQCSYGWIALAMGISVISHIVRAFRWRIQLRALGIEAPRRAIIWSIFGTYAVNLVFPRLGEVWRCGYIATRQKAQFTTVFGSMVADRLTDTIMVALLMCIAFALASKILISYLSQNMAAWDSIVALLQSPWLWVALVAVIAAVWYFMAHKSSNATITKIQNAVRELWNGFAVITTMPGKGRWLFLTIIIWGCYYFQMFLCFYAFPFTSQVLAQYGPLAVLVIFVLSSLAQGVPSNGGIGPWQWAVIFGLGIYGVEKVQAGAFANLVMVSTTLTLILLGIYTFISIALDKKKITKS